MVWIDYIVHIILVYQAYSYGCLLFSSFLFSTLAVQSTLNVQWQSQKKSLLIDEINYEDGLLIERPQNI